MGLTQVKSEDELAKYLPENLLNKFKKTYLVKRTACSLDSCTESEDEPGCKRQHVDEN